VRRFLTILMALTGAGRAATYYVATTGNDTNPGTPARPWRTIGKAAATMVAGDSVLVRAGIYREGVNPARSGTQSDPIAYAAYDTERVIVECSEAVSGWVQDSANRYRAQVSFTPSPRFTSVRDPNGNYGGLVTQNGAKMQYAMEPSPAAVDSPGEYYMNDSLSPPFTLYLCAYDLGRGVHPDSYQMKVGRIRKGLDLDGGEDYLAVDGIEFRGSNDNAIHSIGSEGCEFRNLALYTNFITGIYMTSNSNRCLIERCAFWDNGHGGIELASTRRTVVRKNRFLRRDLGDGRGGNGAHMWLGPLSQFADSNLIENNLAFGTGRYGYQGPFLALLGSYNVVRHNSMVNSAGGAIAMVDGGHNTVVNNACDMSAATMHGVAVFPNACRDSYQFIRGNDFYAQSPTGKYWYDGVIYNSLAEWEAAAHQSGNVCSLPGFCRPDSGDLHLLAGSACIDRGTPDSAAADDYDGIARPQGDGCDVGAFEYLPTGTAQPGEPERAAAAGPTLVRGSLLLPLVGAGALLDVGGRVVAALQPGRNDVRSLPAGVYFLRARTGCGQPSPDRVILLR